jgi:hypothetical protein
MATFNAALHPDLSAQLVGGSRLYVPNMSTNIDTPPQWQTETLAGGNFLEALSTFKTGDWQAQTAGATVAVSRGAVLHPMPRTDWFENIYVIPRKIELGFVLATEVIPMEIYNAYELSPRTFTSFVNNAGAGVVVTGLPSLPFVIQEQDGLSLVVTVSPLGPPTIDGTLDFIFDTETVSVPVTGTRTIVFPFEPEAPLVERLSFLTDVVGKRDGKEQRISLRNTPRQVFEMKFSLDGTDRQFFNAVLFDSQHRTLGVPVWFEPAALSAAAAPGAGVLNVDSTSFADWRVGGFGIVYGSAFDHEIFQVSAVGGTSLNITPALTKGFAAGTRVLPVRLAHARDGARGDRSLLNLQEATVRFTVLDNDVDLASAAAFPALNSKVYLSEANAVDGRMPEEYLRDIIVVDGGTGLFEAFSDQLVGRRAHAKKFFSRTRQRLWEVRQLLHHLKGRQTSFYIPTFFGDLTPTQNITSGGTSVTVSNVGYTDFVQSRQPMNILRLVLKSGTVVTRTVTSSSELSATEEQVDVDSTWGVNATPAEIDSLQFVEEARLDSDEAELVHLDALGQAVVTVPVVSVLE